MRPDRLSLLEWVGLGLCYAALALVVLLLAAVFGRLFGLIDGP